MLVAWIKLTPVSRIWSKCSKIICLPCKLLGQRWSTYIELHNHNAKLFKIHFQHSKNFHLSFVQFSWKITSNRFLQLCFSGSWARKSNSQKYSFLPFTFLSIDFWEYEQKVASKKPKMGKTLRGSRSLRLF